MKKMTADINKNTIVYGLTWCTLKCSRRAGRNFCEAIHSENPYLKAVFIVVENVLIENRLSTYGMDWHNAQWWKSKIEYNGLTQ